MPERTPKAAFIANSQMRDDWEKIVTTKAAEAARDAALLQFIYELQPPTDPSKGWDQASQLAGAKKIVEILFALHLKEESQRVPRMTNLKPPS